MYPAMDANATSRTSQPQALPGPAVAGKPAHDEAHKPGRRELSEAQERKLRELRETDARVRRHEEAHRAAAGSLYRGGPNYTYETGPDGRRYAVAGSVQIDTSPGRTPEETVHKAAQIRRAALAPIDPSGTDRSVASKATRMEDAARRAITKKSMTQDRAAPAPAHREQAPAPIAEAPPVRPADADPKTAIESPQRSLEIEDPEPAAEAPSTDTLSPGDLGGEVWSSVSALNNSAELRQERRADEMPTPAPHLDVLA